MPKIENTGLNEKYSIKLIMHLKRNGPKQISTLTPDVAKNYRTVRNLVDRLDDDGFLRLNEKTSPRPTIMVELTEEGNKLADELLEIEELMERS